MATTELTTTNFDDVTSRDGITLIDFWASWCGPCIRFAPTYEKVSEDHPDITFGKVDTEAQQELAARYQISSIPTIMIIRDQVVVYAQPGALPEAYLRDLIKQVQELDMEQIKSEVTAA
jgi:thioredoxin 1